MSIRNILILTAVINFAAYDSVQGGLIPNTSLPEINVTRIVGRWNLLASIASEDQSVCKYIMMQKLSPKDVAMKITMFDRPASKNNGILPEVRLSEQLVTLTKKNDSESFVDINDNKGPRTVMMTIFDVDYDSYMAVYIGRDVADNDKDDGIVFVLGRDTTLPDGVLEKVQTSEFLQREHTIPDPLKTVDYSYCV